MKKNMSLIFAASFLFSAACVPVMDDQTGARDRSEKPCELFAEPFVYSGDLDLQSADDLPLIKNIQCVTGDLNIVDSNLEEIAGLDSLREIGGSLHIESNANLRALHLPGLQTVHHSLFITSNPLIDELDLPQLMSVAGFFEIVDNAQVLQVSCANLQTADALKIDQNQGLRELFFPQLSWLGVLLQISNNPALPTAQLPMTQAGFLVVLDNAQLAELNLQDIENIWDMEIGANPLLAVLNMDALDSLGQNFSIHDNPLLPDCVVHNLREQLQDASGIGGELDIIDNGGSSCNEQSCNIDENCVDDCSVEAYFSCE